MKRVPVEVILDNSHSLINESVLNTASNLEGCSFVVRLDDLLKERGLTQSDLSAITGLRVGTISNFVNGKELGLNKIHIFAIMSALRVTDLSEIIHIDFPDDIREGFDSDAERWKEDRKVPAKVQAIYRSNTDNKFK